MGEGRLWICELRYSIVLLERRDFICLLGEFFVPSLSVFFVESFWSELLMTFSGRQPSLHEACDFLG
jgi:hypothetical protein